jgi:hypothetical protein
MLAADRIVNAWRSRESYPHKEDGSDDWAGWAQACPTQAQILNYAMVAADE